MISWKSLTSNRSHLRFCWSDEKLFQNSPGYDFAGPTKIVSNLPGQWNKMKIQVINQSYTIFINGEKINEFVGNRQVAGYIGLQAHNEKSVVLFKDIMIKELK